MELGERKLKILQAVIDDYIITGIPVGSRTVARKYLGWSSATIRNEMSDLEEMGFLEQPHASAGRIPSDLAYRLYVERMMREANLSKEDMDIIEKNIDTRINEIEDLVRQTARLISSLTGYTAVALTPQMSKVLIRHVQMVPVATGMALMVIVTDGGIIRDNLVRVPEMMTSDQMYAISNRLTLLLKGLALEEAVAALNNMQNGMLDEYRELTGVLLGAVRQSLQPTEEKSVVLDGASNILKHPEYSDLQKAKLFLASLDERERLYHLLDQATSMEFQFTIGRENAYDDMRDCSVVTVIYGDGKNPLGTIGVIGPTRMDYARVLSVLQHLGKGMSEIIRHLSDGF